MRLKAPSFVVLTGVFNWADRGPGWARPWKRSARSVPYVRVFATHEWRRQFSKKGWVFYKFFCF